jgi:hypothetical protein
MMKNTPLSRAEETALVALRGEFPIPRWAQAALGDLHRRGLLAREGLTDAGVKRADELRATLNGLGSMIRAPHKRDTQYERGRSWAR